MRQSMRRMASPFLCGLLVTLLAGSAASVRAQGAELRLTAVLTGVAPFNGAFGSAEFQAEEATRKFKAQVEDVKLRDGTTLLVSVNVNPVGTITLAAGKGRLELNTQNGQPVPAMVAGDTITITAPGGQTVVNGKLH